MHFNVHHSPQKVFNTTKQHTEAEDDIIKHRKVIELPTTSLYVPQRTEEVRKQSQKLDIKSLFALSCLWNAKRFLMDSTRLREIILPRIF